MLAKAYQKYLYIPRPVSKRYPMDVQHRAKQFAPFAALRGFEEIVRKQEILYEQRKMLSEEQKCGLDRKLQMVSVGMQIQATYFKESREMKPAGQYHTICGTVEFFDPSIHLRIDDTIILIPDLCELSGDIFEELDYLVKYNRQKFLVSWVSGNPERIRMDAPDQQSRSGI